MRYVLLVPAYDAGGISTYSASLARGLSERGDDTRIVFWTDRSSPYGVKSKAGLSAFPCEWVEFDSLDKASVIGGELDAQLSFHHGDVVVSQAFPWISSWIVESSVRAEVRHVEVIHDESYASYGHALRAQATCDLYVAVSRRIAEGLVDRMQSGALAKAPVAVCPCGVDIPSDQAGGRASGPIRLCYVGRLDPIQKRVLDLVRIAKALVAFQVSFELVIVGAGAGRASLEKFAVDCGVAAHVNMLGGVDAEKVSCILARSDAFILTSAWEGFSVAMCEAMAHGVVPIVTRVSGAEDVIREGENGFTFDVGDIDGAAVRLKTLAQDRKLLEAMSRSARRTAALEMGIRARAGMFADAVSQAARRGGGSKLVRTSLHRRLDSQWIPNRVARWARRLWRFVRGVPSDAGKA